MNNILQQYESAIKVTEWDEQAKELLACPRGVIGADTETTGLLFHTPSYLKDDDRWVENPFPFGISLAFKCGEQLVLVWGRYKTELYDECKRILRLPNIKVAHNLKFDVRVCKTNNIEINGPKNCSLTMSRIYWDRREAHGLQELSEFLCPEISGWEVELKEEIKRLKGYWTRKVKKDGIELPEGMEAKEYFNYSFIDDGLIGKYAMIDAYMGFVLYKKLMPIMVDGYWDLYRRERKVIDVVIKIEEAGLAWDIEKGKKEIEKLMPKMEEAEEIISNAYEGFYSHVRDEAIKDYNLIKEYYVLKDYPDQGEIKRLQKEMKLKWAFGPDKILDMLLKLGVKKKQLKSKGKVTTSEDVLRRCLVTGVTEKAREFIENLMEYRAYAKITNTYLKPLTSMAERNGGVIYTNINPTNTRTGRPASCDPNLLNIPKPKVSSDKESNPVRECVTPREGKVIYYFDIVQQELADLFLVAGANELLEAYHNGMDMHQYMADILGKPDERSHIKNCNFAKVYGEGLRAMALHHGITYEEAKETMRIYDEAFPFVRDLQRKCEGELRQFGFVEDFFGRRYHVPVNQAYKAINCLVQGGCAQAFKIGLLNTSEAIWEGHEAAHEHKILLPVYDEIQIEIPKEDDYTERVFCEIVVDRMTDIPQLLDRGLRLRVDVKKSVSNWAEKVEVNL